jgi:uncharacterized membrane protein
MAIFSDWLSVLTFLTTLGCGLMAGVFFAFSSSIMRALAKLPAPEGIAAMQSINIVIVNPLFLLVFVGTALTSIVVAVAALLRWQEPHAVYLLVGGLLYLVGSFMETAVIHIPMNNALDKITPTDPKSASFWADFVTRWTAWNHVRTVASLAAMAFLIFALSK